MPLILASNSASGGYEVDNSLRFNAGSDDSLTRTFGSSGNRKTWTFSTWIKRSNLINANMNILGTDYAGNGEAYFVFRPGETMLYGQYEGGGATNNYSFETTQVFRDVSAWYHILFVWDTTQSTSSNRMKLYINGTQVTSFSTANYPTQNLDGVWNSNRVHYIGDAFYGTNLDGYLSETYFIDGQALTPSSFGETDEDTNIWKPIPYTGTFGTNGFYLEFQNSGALGTDSSGNGNTWTANNLTSVDQSTDTCTNNFCTLNFIQNGNGTTSTLTEGNLVAGTADNKGVAANFGVNRGKWFWEVKNAGTQTNQRFGVSNRANEQDGDASPGGATANVRSYVGLSAFKNYSASSDSSNASFLGTNGTIFGFALDLNNGTLGRYVNGSLINTDTTLPSDNSVTFFPFTFVTYNFGNWNQAQFNFGSPMYTGGGYADANGYGNFSYAVPAGYFALCSKNLAEFG